MAGSVLCLFFFFKQKTAYEMRISDWSSDVCSSDLDDDPGHSWPRDYFGVAVGAISVPRYSGGGENRVLPGFYVRGRVDGYSFSTRGTNLQVNLIRQRSGQRLDWTFGPLINVRSDRSGRTGNAQVDALGKRKLAVAEIGSAHV